MSKTILLADDSVTIRKVVELTFMEEDFELVTATDGREAVDKLRTTTPDLVIADVHMPEVGGFDVCRESKSRHPSVPVLLLVGAFEPFDPADAEACGADRYLKKPFDSQDLLKQVQRLIEGSEQNGEPVAAGDMATEDAASPEGAGVAEAHDEAAQVDAGQVASPELSPSAVDRIARRVVELLADDTVREVAWEVIPDLAETVIKERLRQLESQVD